MQTNKILSTVLTILLTAVITAGGIYIYQNETTKPSNETLVNTIQEELAEETTNPTREANTIKQDQTDKTEETKEVSETTEEAVSTETPTKELTGTPEDIEQDFVIYTDSTYHFNLEIPLGWGAQTKSEINDQEIMNGVIVKSIKISSTLIPKNQVDIIVVPLNEENNIGDMPAKELFRNSEYIFLGARAGCYGRPGCESPEDERREQELESVLDSFLLF